MQFHTSRAVKQAQKAPVKENCRVWQSNLWFGSYRFPFTSFFEMSQTESSPHSTDYAWSAAGGGLPGFNEDEQISQISETYTVPGFNITHRCALENGYCL